MERTAHKRRSSKSNGRIEKVLPASTDISPPSAVGDERDMPVVCVDNPVAGSRIKLEVGPTDNVGDVMKLIQDLEGIPMTDQRLTFNGEELRSTATLNEYLTDGETLQLTTPKRHRNQRIGITVQESDKTKSTQLFVDTSDKVEKLKAAIQDLCGLPAEYQMLYHEGMPIEDGYALVDYGIKDGSVIKLRNSSHYKKKKKTGTCLIM
jgi:hypothetical protein